MSKFKRIHSAAFKTKVALDALKEELTQSQITSKHGIHASQISQWKHQALDAIKNCFSKKLSRDIAAQALHEATLYEQIGRLQAELNWLKKKSKLVD